MSLIKSFNWKFLMQNLKKAKGTVLLCLIIVPLILSIYLVVSGIEIHSPEIGMQEAIRVIDAIFMYIIPFVLSVVLFGFVFRKSSTDFMNSMPINRTTMFITNTIGGILLITIIQVASAIIALLWGAIFTNVIVFSALVLDTMIVSWISYVFVFVTTNLAMTISGTQKTQLLVTALILFLIPICIELTKSIREVDYYGHSYTDTGYRYDIAIESGYKTTYFDTLDSVKNYTMPFKLFRYGLRYSWQTNLRMVILTVIYFFLGLKLYQKKKMEFSEESFSSLKLHLIAKGLTLIPVLLFVNALNAYSRSITAFIVAVILCAVYYVIFDIVSKRKVPVATTIASFAGTIFVIQALIMFAGSADYKTKDIDVEDIKEISIGKNSNASDFFYNDNNLDNSILDGNYFIQDEQILDLILDGVHKLSVSSEDVENFDLNEEYLGREIYFNIKLKSGKEYYIRTNIAEKNYNEILSILARDDDYMKHIKQRICNSDGVITVGQNITDNKTTKKIEKVLKNNFETMELFSSANDDVYYITKTVYQNNQIIKYCIPLSDNEKLLKEVAIFTNRQTLENIKGYQNGMNAYVHNQDRIIGDIYNDYKILRFMEEHAADEFVPSQEYYIISGGLHTRNGYKSFVFYTNDINEIDSMISKNNRYNDWY